MRVRPIINGPVRSRLDDCVLFRENLAPPKRITIPPRHSGERNAVNLKIGCSQVKLMHADRLSDLRRSLTSRLKRLLLVCFKGSSEVRR